MVNYSPYGPIGTPIAYAMGGGSIGGPNVWDFSSGRPQLTQAARSIGTMILPAGALSRQEIRNRQDVQQILQSGKPYVEAPTQYILQKNRSGLPMYVNPLTGQSIGTMAASWAASETPIEEQVKRQKEKDKKEVEKKGSKEKKEEKEEEKKIPQTAMGISGTPLAFTKIGSTIGINPNLASPFAGGFGNSGLTGFGEIPNFPFSNY